MKKILKQTITIKTKFLISLLLLSISLLFCLTTVSAASGDTIYVSGSGDDSWDGLSWGTAKLSIKNATGTVNTNGTIHIANGQYTGENNTNITINKNMNIIGENQKKTIINGTGTNWILKVNSGVTVTITNLTITNATTGNGSAIYNKGTLTATNCTFINSNAVIPHNYSNGTIFNTGTITSLSGCNFTNNIMIGNGGAIVNMGTINNLSNCDFTNNTAFIGSGGAILNNGTITILSDCNFTNNTATYYGGAIYNIGNISSLSGCNFTNNTAVISIIYNTGTITSLSGCNFTNNTATTIMSIIYNDGTITSLNNCNFTNNTATAGGAIYNIGNISSLSGCNFTNNTATYYGGAILNIGNISLSGCTFTNNKADDGGAILNIGNISLSGCNFINNNATYGGAILNGGLIINGEVVGNGGTISSLSGCNFINNTATDDNGGAIYNIDKINALSGCNFINNTAANRGGAIYNIGRLNVLNSDFTDNNANNGGAVYNDGNLTVNGCNFINNAASGFFSLGGSIFNDQHGNLTVANSIFTGNNATNGNGGAIWNSGGTLTTPVTITGSTFKDNTAINGNGGAINNGGILTVSNSNFINNTATSFFGGVGGGAICNTGYAILTVSNSIFINNTADSGGAIYNQYYGNATILNSTLTGNNATTTDYGGGAIYNDGDLTVNSSKLNNNNAASGGGIYNTSNLTAVNCTFTGNAATDGGAIYNDGNLNISGCTFKNNAANYGFGGAIYNKGKLNAQNCTFTGNTASQGGAIFNFGGLSSSVITGCTFTNNSADQGGAIANVAIGPGSHINSVITSCTFRNNTATDCGGAIFMTGGFNNDVQIHFNRILNNTGIDVYSVGAGTNATNNWWGSNFGGNNPILAGKASDNVIIDSWVILSINATPNNINNTQKSTITADFNHINGGSDLIGGHIPDGPVTLDIPWGSFTNSRITHSITLNTLEGAATTLFYANEGAVNPLFNPVKVTATADNYTTNNTESDYITINKASDLYIKITSDKKNHKVGETFTLTYKLGNNGPDAASNVTVTIPLPEGFEVSQITGDGNWTYNSATRTITWTLENVPVGDPYLYITGKVTKAGTYVFSSSISSETYNINSEGVTPVTIKAVNEVKAASKNIPLQKTGLPLNYLILAILMVLSGLLPKRK